MKSAWLFSAALACIASPALAQPLPTLPDPDGTPAPAGEKAQTEDAPEAPAPAMAAAPTPQQLYEHVRRGLVLLTRNGFPLAVGTVLGNDGRILTALSGLNGAEGADVLYSDGTSVHAKVGPHDRALDLALLVPETHKAIDGLAASELDPQGTRLRALLPSRGAKLAPAPADVKGSADAHARSGQPLLRMLDVNVRGPLVAGAPLLDPDGNVAAVLVRACKGAAAEPSADDAWSAWGGAPQSAARSMPCAPVVVGAPVSTIRSFLSKVGPAAPAAPPPAAPLAAAPWLGIRGQPDAAGAVKGVRITAVAPKSPAEAAGLKASSDVIAAVDGQPIDSPAKLAEAIGKHAPGDVVKLLVFGQERFRDVSVTLRPAP